MGIIARPPNFKEIIAGNPGEVFSLINKFGPIDAKGRYLAWDEFRRRNQEGADKNMAWAAVKLARLPLLRPLGDLVSEKNQPLSYCIPDSLQGYLHTIDRLCSPLLHATDTTVVSSGERNRYLVDSLMMEEAISSAQLEGAATTRKVAKAMLENEQPPRNEDERMVFNNFLLLKAAKANLEDSLSLELICHFHEIATHGTSNPHVTPGELRQADDIIVQGRDGETVHQPPMAANLSDRLARLCDFANTRHDGQEGRQFIHPAVKAVALHFMLGYEHPFADGNGRTARALFYWYMLKEGYWPFEYISISALLKEAAVLYGKSYLYTETDDFDLTYFLDYQLRTIDRAIRQFLAYLDRKKREYYDLMEWMDDSGLSAALNYRQGQLLRKALRHPGRVFTVKEVKHDFGVADNTARTDLQRLVALKVLAPVKDAKIVHYVARADARDSLRLNAKTALKQTSP